MIKKRGILIILVALVIVGVGLGLRKNWFSSTSSEKEIPSEASPASKSTPSCTLYTNEEYGFSLCYPVAWSFPRDNKITPPQQHLYQITLNPKGMSYMVNIYDQPSPISLGSFVRSYFNDVEAGVSWTNDLEINDQEALQFFIPKADTELRGIGGVAFRRGGFILTISTPAKKLPEEDLKKLVNEEVLTQLVESFQWVEE